MTTSNLSPTCSKFLKQQLVRALAGVLTASSLSLLSTPRAIAASFSLTKVIDSQDTFPGTSFLAVEAYFEPAIDSQGNIAVISSSREIYRIPLSGISEQIVGGDTPILDPLNDFSWLRSPDIEADRLFFYGDTASGDGIFKATVNGQVTPLVAPDDTLPGLTENQQRFIVPIFGSDGKNVSLTARTGGPNSASAVYSINNGLLQVVADSNTLIPNEADRFDLFSLSDISGQNVLFSGEKIGGQQGIYLSRNGVLETVIDNTTPIPNGPGTFRILAPAPPNPKNPSPFPSSSTLVSWLSLDGDKYTFTAFDANGEFGGLYTNLGGTLRPVFDTNTLIPGMTDTFSLVGSELDPVSFLAFPAISGDIIAFQSFMPVEPAESNNFFDVQPQGIYAEISGDLQKIVDVNDTLDGKAIRSLGFFSTNALSDNFLVFSAEFEDGVEALYRVEFDKASDSPVSVPEGSAVWGLAAIAGLMTITRLRSRLPLKKA